MRWEKVLSNGSGGAGKRWAHTCNAVRGGRLLYVFGGYDQHYRQSNKIHVFDSVDRTWSEPVVRGTPPLPRDSHTCTTVGDSLFVFGGTNERSPLNDLHILDTASNTWSSPTVRGDGPGPREGHGAALVDEQLFIFGGIGKSEDGDVYYNDLFILNTETYVWKCVTPSGTPPTKRECHSCSSYKNKIIVIGGEDYCNRYLSDIHILDTDTLMWCKLNTTGEVLPPRAGHTTVSFGKNLLVFGGFSHGQNLYDDIYILNIETAIWTKVLVTGECPFTRFSMAGERLDPQLEGVLVFFGGCNKNLEALDDIYFLHTGLVMEIDQGAIEGLSLRKQLKSKCQEQCTPASSYHKTLVSDGNNANVHHGLRRQPGALSFDLNELPPPEEKMILKGKVTETFQEGFFFETVMEGAPLRLFFSKKPNSNMPAGSSTRDVRQCDGGNQNRLLPSESNIEISPAGPFPTRVSQEVSVAVTSPVASYAGREYNGQRNT